MSVDSKRDFQCDVLSSSIPQPQQSSRKVAVMVSSFSSESPVQCINQQINCEEKKIWRKTSLFENLIQGFGERHRGMLA